MESFETVGARFKVVGDSFNKLQKSLTCLETMRPISTLMSTFLNHLEPLFDSF